MTTAPTPLHRRHVPQPLALTLFGVVVGAAIVLGILLVHGNTGAPSTLHGSGKQAVQGRTVAPFHAVDLAGANNVTVYVGGPRSVSVRADDNLIKYVTTRVRRGTLAIGQSRSFSTSGPMRVEISVPSLDAVTLSGTGVVDVTGVRTARLVVRVPGSGTLTATGRATVLDAALAGAGDVRLQGLVARDVTATVSGTGRLHVDATRSLHARLSGTGAIVYSGNPMNVTESSTGTGSITRG